MDHETYRNPQMAFDFERNHETYRNPSSNEVKVLNDIKKFQSLRKKINNYKNFAYLQLFTEEDYSKYTNSRNCIIKENFTLSCCDEEVPYAWKVKLEEVLKDEENSSCFLTSEAICQKHAKILCKELMKKTDFECQCQLHLANGHEKCSAWRSKGVVGTYTNADSCSFPKKMSDDHNKITNSNEKRKHLGQIRYLDENEKKQLSIHNSGCVQWCYKQDDWCCKPSFGTIKFNWSDIEIEQNFCKDHIERHCQLIRVHFPYENCLCTHKKDPCPRGGIKVKKDKSKNKPIIKIQPSKYGSYTRNRANTK